MTTFLGEKEKAECESSSLGLDYFSRCPGARRGRAEDDQAASSPFLARNAVVGR